jgi:hypothetical protein
MTEIIKIDIYESEEECVFLKKPANQGLRERMQTRNTITRNWLYNLIVKPQKFNEKL